MKTAKRTKMMVKEDYIYAHPNSGGIPVLNKQKAKSLAKRYRGGGNYAARIKPFAGKYTVIVRPK